MPSDTRAVPSATTTPQPQPATRQNLPPSSLPLHPWVPYEGNEYGSPAEPGCDDHQLPIARPPVIKSARPAAVRVGQYGLDAWPPEHALWALLTVHLSQVTLADDHVAFGHAVHCPPFMRQQTSLIGQRLAEGSRLAVHKAGGCGVAAPWRMVSLTVSAHGARPVPRSFLRDVRGGRR